MNIAFVNSTKIWSGVKSWMLEFGNELRDLGDEVSYIVGDPRFAGELERQGHDVALIRFGPDYSPRAVWRCFRLLRRRRVDVTCMNIQKELRTAGIAARLAGIPVVHRVGLSGDLTDKWDQRLTRRWIVDRMLVPSATMKADLLAQRPGLDADGIAVVHNAKAVTAAPHPARSQPVRFVVASRLHPDKRQGDLVAALARLRESGLEGFRADLYGDGPAGPALEARIAAAGLQDAVRLCGFSRELATALPDYDFGVLTSGREGLPNTVLEFMAAGLPVVATDVGGVGEAVSDGSEGWLYRPGDVDALTAHLRRCLEMSEADYAAMSARAIQTMRSRFAPQPQARLLHDLFAETARSRGGNARAAA